MVFCRHFLFLKKGLWEATKLIENSDVTLSKIVSLRFGACSSGFELAPEDENMLDLAFVLE